MHDIILFFKINNFLLFVIALKQKQIKTLSGKHIQQIYLSNGILQIKMPNYFSIYSMYIKNYNKTINYSQIFLTDSDYFLL